MPVTLVFLEKPRPHRQTGHGDVGAHLGPDWTLLLWEEPCPSPDHTAPQQRMLPAAQQVSHLHWPWLDRGAIPAHAAQGRYAGCSFLGQQVPAGIGAQVACRVSWIQDDGPGITTQGQSYSRQHPGIPLGDWLGYFPPSPNTLEGSGAGPRDSSVLQAHTLEGRIENKLHRGPFYLLHPGRHYQSTTLAPSASKAGIINQP